MKLRKIVSLAFVTLALGALGAGSASAATTPLVGSGAFARTVPFIDGYLYAYACHANAPGAISTSVVNCKLGSVAAPPATAPGPAAFTYGGVSQASSPTSVCWTVSARYTDGTTQTKNGCSTVSAIAGAGAG
jgi:hypothetical protein